MYHLINDKGYQYEIYSAPFFNMYDPESFFKTEGKIYEFDKTILVENFSNIEYFDIAVTGGMEVDQPVEEFRPPRETSTKFRFDDVSLTINPSNESELNLEPIQKVVL